MIRHYRPFFKNLEDTALLQWSKELQTLTQDAFLPEKNGHSERWNNAWNDLPDVLTEHVNLSNDCIQIGTSSDLNANQSANLKEALMGFHPWRKGPFCFFDTKIETEWRSDWKWDRIKPHIKPLKDGIILDIGCGSGYHCWRMLDQDPKLVLGIDPFLAFVWQFLITNRYIRQDRFATLPIGVDELPQSPSCFSTIFSMGVLYHRKDPVSHLYHIKELLRKGGEIVLETLVIEGDEKTVLVPQGRYAKMRNVWFIPSKEAILLWMKKSGFRNVRMVHECKTSIEEQRQTEWMTFESLKDFLDPDDSSLTIEGYPAPHRAVFIAEK